MVRAMFFLTVLGSCWGFFQHQISVQHPVALAPAVPSTAAYATRSAAEQPAISIVRPVHAEKSGAKCSGWVVLAGLAVLGIATSRAKLSHKQRALGRHGLAENMMERELASTEARHKLAMLTLMGSDAKAKFDSKAYAQSLPGVCDPTGYFDPLGFCDGISKSKVNYLREAELKHGRLGMLNETYDRGRGKRWYGTVWYSVAWIGITGILGTVCIGKATFWLS